MSPMPMMQYDQRMMMNPMYNRHAMNNMPPLSMHQLWDRPWEHPTYVPSNRIIEIPEIHRPPPQRIRTRREEGRRIEELPPRDEEEEV